MAADWQALLDRLLERYRDGEERLSGLEDVDARQRQLTRLGNVAAGAGLVLLMEGRRAESAEWLARAASRYRESWEDAPPGSWGRLIGALKARLLAGDAAAAEADARSALEAGAAGSDSPIGRYAACLACLVLGHDVEARPLASSLRERDDFPHGVADALAALAAADRLAYIQAVEDVLDSFEEREAHLEDVPVADTVLLLQALAAARDLAAELESPLLPR